jgi:hypothetical protein
MRLDGFAEGESIGGLQINLRDENIAASVLIDPFDRAIGIGCRSGFRPTEGLEGMRQGERHPGIAVHNQNFHGASCLR